MKLLAIFTEKMIGLLHNNLLSIVDVDARSAWHVVVLHAHEVVVSIVGLSVGSNSVNGFRTLLGNSH